MLIDNMQKQKRNIANTTYINNNSCWDKILLIFIKDLLMDKLK